MKFINDVHLQMTQTVTDEQLQPFVYLLSKRLKEGSTCLELDVNNKLPDNILDELPEDIRKPFLQKEYDAYSSLNNKDNPWITQSADMKKPFVLYENKVYFYRFFDYENRIIEKLKQLIRTQSDDEFRNRGKKLIDYKIELNKEFLSTPDLNENDDVSDWQLVAAVHSFKEKFMIITGGPGTGKTTTIQKIIKIVSALLPETRIALAAPTGKAANRMKQALTGLTKSDPITIHRLLGITEFNINGKYNEQKPLDYDLVIVDEASMIDTSLFSKLMRAIPVTSQLILLGDKNQLASVEAGSLFGDLCYNIDSLNKIESGSLDFINSVIADRNYQISKANILQENKYLLAGHIIELRYNHRFRSNPRIGEFSKAVLKGDQDIIKALMGDSTDESLTIDTNYDSKYFEAFVKQYQEYMMIEDDKKALNALNQLKVLCAVRQGEQGVYKVNRRIENYLKEKIRDKEVFAPNDGMYHNRPIMVIKNYYDLDLFNGDIGLIRKIGKELKAVFLNDKGEVRPINPALIPEVETVFAMTIHKCQGSEFDQVMVILPQNEEIKLLTKELLYTAITRARKIVRIQGHEKIILDSAARSVRRSSGIANRLISAV